MITTELFILLKLFVESDVSWWWIVLFILSDTFMWATLKGVLE